eukprot:NODE_970_length_2834_cov_0.203656.p1 type:complete len:461 gc:universal NODE_970_length_2834_cov_0.203656:221-1603(+)
MIYHSRFRKLLFPGPRHGFTKSRSTASQIHSLILTMKRFYSSHGKVYAVALDLSTAFDCLKHQDVFHHVHSHLDNHDTNILRQIITNQSFYLRRDPNKTAIPMRRGTPQGGTLSPLVFAFVMDRILEEIPISDDYALFLYADDLIICTHDYRSLQNITNMTTSLLIDHGFKTKDSKFQFITTNDEIEGLLLQNNIFIPTQSNMMYLGVVLNAYGIDYEADIKLKLQKVNFAISQISWTNRLLQFKQSFYRFYKGIICPIYGYNIENYDDNGLDMLEQHRTKMIKSLHRNKYRYFQYIHNYYTIHHLYASKVINFNKQLTELGMNEIDCTFMNRKDINYSNQLNMEWEWNNQPDQYRASEFKSHHKILKMAVRKNPTHLQVLYDGFLSGTLPRKPIGNQEIKCSYCHKNFEGLDHFRNTCSYTEMEYKTRESIYKTLQSTSKRRITKELKFLRDSNYCRSD